MPKPKGITVTLIDRTQTGTDAFNRPVYADVEIPVDNVLIGEPSTEDVANEFNLSGKTVAYTLAIPKGDTNDWTNRQVSFWGETFRTIGSPTQGIETLIPLDWNRKVRVERYG